MRLEKIAEVLQECIDCLPYADSEKFFRLHGKKISCLIQFVECTTDDSNYILYGLWVRGNHEEEITEVSRCDFIGHFELTGEGNHMGGFYPETLEEKCVRADIKRVLKREILPVLRKGMLPQNRE